MESLTGYRSSRSEWTWDLGSGFRVIGELARTFVPDTDISTASTRGYVSLLKPIDNWTPYVVYAFLRSTPGRAQSVQQRQLQHGT